MLINALEWTKKGEIIIKKLNKESSINLNIRNIDKQNW